MWECNHRASGNGLWCCNMHFIGNIFHVPARSLQGQQKQQTKQFGRQENIANITFAFI